MRSRSYTLAVALAAGLIAHVLGCGGASAAPAVPTGVVVARYAFDAGAGADNSGRGHTLTVIAGHGGSVRTIAHGTGRALAFPAKCTAMAKRSCPHVVLQTRPAADLNPGTRPIAYGAAVRLARSQTTKGQNILQKGYSATTSQYKLQIDGAAGRPSCVLVDDRKPAIRLVRSSVSVADGAWHAVECRRAGAVFTIVVDRVVRGVLAIPAALSVRNGGPLSVGGKGASANNDQFQGALDNVWVRIG
ncbi:MAG TPA: LamG-like jellyroll fold domain-containing protein [Actinoplanes sp.]